jgi:hypothetical protein
LANARRLSASEIAFLAPKSSGQTLMRELSTELPNLVQKVLEKDRKIDELISGLPVKKSPEWDRKTARDGSCGSAGRMGVKRKSKIAYCFEAF